MKKFLFICLLSICILLAGGYFWWQIQLSPVDASDTTQQTFAVKQGEPIRTIANNLQQAGLIKNATAFLIIVKLQKLENKIQSGDFRLSPSLSLKTIAEDLTHGSMDYWVTIPEGKRAEEIADILQQKSPNYQVSWREKLDENEGYLFPDSYLIPTSDNINDIIKLLRENFEKKYAAIGSTDKSQKEVVTIASIIEREASFAEDRPLVASVLYNRLDQGMALQVDPSVSYALGYNQIEHTWWKQDLTVDDLKVNSPYNTYLNPGLPPTPISNPGFSALQAAAHPAQTNYMYYVSDKTGKLHFAKTLDQHNANVAKYMQ